MKVRVSGFEVLLLRVEGLVWKPFSGPREYLNDTNGEAAHDMKKRRVPKRACITDRILRIIYE